MKKAFRFLMFGLCISMLSLVVFNTSTQHSSFAQTLSSAECFLALNPSSVNCVSTATLAMPTGALTTGTCATAASVAMAGVTTASTINWSFASNPVGVVGYGSGGTLAAPGVVLQVYPTTGSGNVLQCNNGSGSITPGAMTLNLRSIP